jgi:hypothetical protein
MREAFWDIAANTAAVPGSRIRAVYAKEMHTVLTQA